MHHNLVQTGQQKGPFLWSLELEASFRAQDCQCVIVFILEWMLPLGSAELMWTELMWTEGHHFCPHKIVQEKDFHTTIREIL